MDASLQDGRKAVTCTDSMPSDNKAIGYFLCSASAVGHLKMSGRNDTSQMYSCMSGHS